MITLNAGCPHLTGVVHNGYEECEMGKACDYDCEWIKLKRAEQKLIKIEDRVQDLDNYSEKNVEIMEDILTIINGE